MTRSLDAALSAGDYESAAEVHREMDEHLCFLRGDPTLLPADLLAAAQADAVAREDYEAAANIKAEMQLACELADAPDQAFNAIWALRGGATARRAAIVTGGTRGIGRGISEALAESGHDLLLTYNSDSAAAEAAADELRGTHGCTVVCCGGDISLEATRDAVFASYDDAFGASHTLAAVVHNAGQYVGITSSNADGLEPAAVGFGDGSLLDESGRAQLAVMKYYQRLYGDAYVDLCERGLARMTQEAGGSLVGISSPGCTLQYKANLGVDTLGRRP